MRKIVTEYISKNQLRFHHSISLSNDNYSDSLQPESHHMCEIIFMLSGSVTYKIEGQSYKLSPYDAIIIHPNKLHSREIDEGEPYERMVLHFSPELLPSFADLNLLSNYSECLLPSILPKRIIEKTNLLSLMQGCEDLCKNQNTYTDLRMVGIILQIIETLNEIILNLDHSQTPAVKVDKLSSDCIKFINQNLTDIKSLSIEALAKRFYVSVSHLQHTFKKQIGISLKAYILNQKMQLARKLLSQGKTPLAVANMLGYEYYSTFYHSFKKRFGVSPNSNFKE